jgi:hypothetical protein
MHLAASKSEAMLRIALTERNRAYNELGSRLVAGWRCDDVFLSFLYRPRFTATSRFVVLSHDKVLAVTAALRQSKSRQFQKNRERNCRVRFTLHRIDARQI